jgi:cell division protease FtsH
MTRSQFKAMIASALGGHVAERLVFGEVSTGAENDIDKATSIARSMVTTYGMSASLGPVALVQRDSGGYLGAGAETRQYSERVAEAVDAEVRGLIEAGLARAERILVEHQAELQALADLLIEQETVEGEDLERVLSGNNGSAEVKEPASARPLHLVGEVVRPAFGPLPRLAPGLASASLQD